MILVTGANGFVGKELTLELLKRDFNVIAALRSVKNEKFSNNEKIKFVYVGDISSETDWSEALQDVTVIIHCAARVHVMNDKSLDPMKNYMEVNYDGTRRLAEQANIFGVKKFIFLSSIKVNGDESYGDSAIKHTDLVNPSGSYALSKYYAENFLLEFSRNSNLDIVIIRTPLVYGLGVKGNLEKICKLISLGIPLPLASVKNSRSLISVYNLVDLLICCITNNNSSGKIFLVSDGVDLSTAELVSLIAKSMGVSLYIFNFPIKLLLFFGFILNKKSEINRLTGSLKIDDSFTRESLGWSPKFSVHHGIKKMTFFYTKNKIFLSKK